MPVVTFADVCFLPSCRYAVQGGTLQARKMAVNVLCSVLNFDPEARKIFAKYGGLGYVNQVLKACTLGSCCTCVLRNLCYLIMAIFQ